MADSQNLKGADEIIRKLRGLERRMPEMIENAMRAELEIEREESMRRTPVDTGALRASHVVKTRRESGGVVGIIGVGGPAAPYAVIVHEDMEAIHPVGQAKFLESTLLESKPYMAARIAARLRVDLEGAF